MTDGHLFLRLNDLWSFKEEPLVGMSAGSRRSYRWGGCGAFSGALKAVVVSGFAQPIAAQMLGLIEGFVDTSEQGVGAGIACAVECAEAQAGGEV